MTPPPAALELRKPIAVLKQVSILKTIFLKYMYKNELPAYLTFTSCKSSKINMLTLQNTVINSLLFEDDLTILSLI